MARRNKSIPDPWPRFVKIRLEIFCRALDLLTITDEMKKNEDEITKALYPKLGKACFEHIAKPEIPAWDRKIGAISEGELGFESIGKRPDFTCGFIDPTADAEEKHMVCLHIECKCIGFNRETSPSWDLNNNYIKNGINRFDSLSHEYGRNAKDGIMIGYIISSAKPDIQNIINDKLPEKIEKLNFVSRSKVEKVSTKIIREVVKPVNFTIHHIWADYA